MLIAALALGGVGLVAALGLGIAAKVFYVEVDPLVQSLEEALPGANCGGCGHAGCSAAAVALSKGLMAPNGCVGGGPDVAVELAGILGVEIKEAEPEVARVGCRYPLERADTKYIYTGVNDCRAAVMMAGGPKECPIGCLGLGSCVAACPFNALSIGPDGLPVVNESLCTGCGTCVRTCPMGIINLTSTSLRILGEYKQTECTAPCQRTCPAGIDIPEQIRQTQLGNYDQALMVVKERNPLPLICGRICQHPCELACRRNLADEPVAINYLKRFVADLERKRGVRVQPYKAPATGRRMAVIGGGAEGLTAAYFLARLGHSPSLYEAADKLGGLLRTVIPENRLPRDVLDWEIEGILDMGVTAHTGRPFGTGATISELLAEGNEAIVVATGGWDSLLIRDPLQNPAPALPSIYLLLPLTLAWATGLEADLGGRVVLIGGGTGALDAARKIKADGAAEVTVLLGRSQEMEGVGQAAHQAAEADGVKIEYGAAVDRLIGQGDKLTGVVVRRGEGEETLAVDAIVAASGRLPEMIIVPDASEGAEPGAWRTLKPYRDPRRWPSGLFDVGEPVSDYRATVEAIGGGRRLAASTQAYLEGDEIAPPEGMLPSTKGPMDVDRLENLFPVAPRQPMPTADAESRLDPRYEIELGYDPTLAKAEAQRCLTCGLICYQRTDYSGSDRADGYTPV